MLGHSVYCRIVRVIFCEGDLQRFTFSKDARLKMQCTQKYTQMSWV